MDILDDPYREGKEVFRHNPWLSYSTYWHRLREFGVTTREIDMLDETPLTSSQMRSFVGRVLGLSVMEMPDPDIDIDKFCTFIAEAQKALTPPITHCLALRRPAPWFEVDAMKRVLKKDNKSQGGCLLL